jgi:hypothetical protein
VDSPEDSPAAPSRWYQRVLPVTLVGLVVVALAALLVPSVRHQLGLSVTRKPARYVELYFAEAASGRQAVCIRNGASIRVRFVIESHLERRRAVRYRVAIDPSAKGLPTRREAGSTGVSPGKTRDVKKSFTLPGDEGYVVSVVLPGLDQRLRAHCRAGRS